MTNAFILCDLVWTVQKSHAANRERIFKIKGNMSCKTCVRLWLFTFCSIHFNEPYGIGCKYTWCKKIYRMYRATWLNPLTYSISRNFCCYFNLLICNFWSFIKFHCDLNWAELVIILIVFSKIKYFHET